MEVTKTFARTFRDLMRAKLRSFARCSFYRYAVGVAIITVSVHGSDPALTSAAKLTRGLIYFAALCLCVVLLYVISATIQSRRITPRMITFTKERLVVAYKGNSTDHDWNWIISASESSTAISLLVQKIPRLELYLPKTKLNESEYDNLRGWLVTHGKLQPLDNVG